MPTPDWDRAAHRRRDARWLAHAWGKAELLVVWRSKNLFTEQVPPRPLALRTADYPELGREGPRVFLGLLDKA